MSAEVAARYWFDEPLVAPLGLGHIHNTYIVTARGEQFVLQRVNEVVFTDPELVMAQTTRLLAHWRQQNSYLVPELQVSKSGAKSLRIDGHLWRMWRYVGNTAVIDPLENPAQARAAGAAFAALQKQLASLPGPPLLETIPGFLQLGHYLHDFDQVADAAPADLRKLVQDNRGLAQQLDGCNAHIHGDCKVNNLLFDEAQLRVVAIIDFDTAMYGHWAWDFGDLVRSVCFSLGGANADFFAACLQGFGAHQPLTNATDAVSAPGYVALMLGVRFLTDHLCGDEYFRVSQHGENLQRAQQQFALFEEFQALQPRLVEAAKDVLG